MEASLSGRSNVTKCVLQELQVDVDQKNIFVIKALSVAGMNNRMECARLLFSEEPLLMKNWWGDTPLDDATELTNRKCKIYYNFIFIGIHFVFKFWWTIRQLRIDLRNEGRQKHPNKDGGNTFSSNSNGSSYKAPNEGMAKSQSTSSQLNTNQDQVGGNGSPPFHRVDPAQGGTNPRPKQLRTIKKLQNCLLHQPITCASRRTWMWRNVTYFEKFNSYSSVAGRWYVKRMKLAKVFLRMI